MANLNEFLGQKVFIHFSTKQYNGSFEGVLGYHEDSYKYFCLTEDKTAQSSIFFHPHKAIIEGKNKIFLEL